MAKPKKVKEEVSERSKDLSGLVSSLQKKYGEGSVFHGENKVSDVTVIPTGSMTLDKTIGVGGIPVGRVVEIYGPEASGKTTLTLHAIASAQKEGKTCAFVDVEQALDPKYATALGVDMKTLLMSQPDYGEQALDIVRELAESGQIDLIVVDSVAALVPKTELEGDVEKSNMGLQARMMSKALRMITPVANKNKCTIIFINQIRLKIGIMFGNPQTTTGGEALKYYASLRLDVRSGEKEKDKDGKLIGGTMRVKVVKNKVSAPFTECEIPVIYGKGFDRVKELYIQAAETGVLDIRGAHHYLKEGDVEVEKLASSRDEMMGRLREDKELVKRITKMVAKAE